jgi:diaminopimelate epimerase
MMLELGPQLQESQDWDGMNVHFVQTREPNSKDISSCSQLLSGGISEIHKTYVWERGAGETQACGSGACAIAACTLSENFVSRDDWVVVDMPGGRLYAKQESADSSVTLAGPAQYVYSGKIEI